MALAFKVLHVDCVVGRVVSIGQEYEIAESDTEMWRYLCTDTGITDRLGDILLPESFYI